MKTGYIRDCRPLNESLPNCYNVTMHDFKYSYCFCQEDNCNKDDNCICNTGPHALTCQKCGNAGECSSMEDNGVPKVCDDGEACMLGTDYSDMKTGYIRDCRPLNESLPNCYNVTMHDFKYSYCFCQEDNCNKDDNCVY